MKKKFDLIIVGSGPGGYVAAIRAAQLNLKVAIVENEKWGGICLNWGCIPTKALLRSAEIFSLILRSKEFGLETTDLKYNIEEIVKRSIGIADQLSSGVNHLLKKNGVEIFKGFAKLIDSKSVQIISNDSKVELEAQNIIIATGAKSRDLPNLKADGKCVWNYKHALRPNKVPKRLLVVGSGAIGVEFASFYNSLGTEVVVVEVLDRIISNEDRDISNFAKKKFEEFGISFKEKSSIKSFEAIESGVEAVIESNGGSEKINCDAILLAVGITGNVENIGLEDVGISTSNSHINTDEFCETDVAGIYAIGDVAGAPWLAHKASHEGVMVVEKIAGMKPKPFDRSKVAACTFSHPQIASVGLTEEEARKSGYEIKIGKFPFIGNGKALAMGESEGLIKTIFDSKTGELIGAHLVGSEVTEMISTFVLGRQLETTEEEIIETIFPHPTMSEMLHESVLDSEGRSIHF